MRFLLDTNIVSNAIKLRPSDALLEWMGRQADQDLAIATLTLAEIRRGILNLPAGKRRNDLAMVRRAGRATGAVRGSSAALR